MIRWTLICLVLSAGAVALIWAVAPNTIAEQPSAREAATDHSTAARPRSAFPATVGLRGKPELIEYGKLKQQTVAETIIISGATLVIAQQQEVASEKEGNLVFIGTDVAEGEEVPLEKQLPDAEIGLLVVPLKPGEVLKEGETPFKLYKEDATQYRRLRESEHEQAEPKRVNIARESHKVRKLQQGDKVKPRQLLALVNPRKALADLQIKVAKLNAAEDDRAGSEAQKVEFQKRYERQMRQNQITPGSVPQEEIGATLAQRAKHAAEEKVKTGEIEKAKAELSASLVDLRMHEIRASIGGIVKVIYKNHQGDAVKPNEPVLQIQNPDRLRVEGLLEVQEALKLKLGMPVIIEASRPESPRLVIGGHLRPVTCVAVSKGERPIVVSGSEDETLRGWDSTTGEKLWQLGGLRSAVRAVACTPPRSKRNLVLFGCADGMVRLLDLDNRKAGVRDLAERHEGPVNGVAFSPDGEVCATCGEDRSIRLWKTETGELLHRLTGVHRNAITSVQFASAKLLVSAGKDGRLVVWDVESGKPPRSVSSPFEGRSAEVAQVGVSPDGRFVLFDQGKELRLLSLADKELEGTLQNPADQVDFSTMALFSPDGKTILTNGAAAGRLQLWRTPSDQARASELRQFIWTKGPVTCGAFAPEDGSFAVTGTQDHQVLVWTMPEKKEVESRLEGRLTLVEKYLDTQSRQVRVWAELPNPGWLIPGSRATMVVPPEQK